MIENRFTSNLLIAIFFSFLSFSAFADGEYIDPLWEDNSEARVAVVNNKYYLKSCGSCHDAYSAGLLLPQSWEKIMMTLNSHFEQKVVLDQKSYEEALNYLLGNAAGRAKYALSSRIVTGIKDEQPIRITALPFFINKHKSVTSSKLSHCSNCHTKAAQGSYDKKEIKKLK